MLDQLLLVNPIGMNGFVMKRLGQLEVWGTSSPGEHGRIDVSHTVPET